MKKIPRIFSKISWDLEQISFFEIRYVPDRGLCANVCSKKIFESILSQIAPGNTSQKSYLWIFSPRFLAIDSTSINCDKFIKKSISRNFSEFLFLPWSITFRPMEGMQLIHQEGEALLNIVLFSLFLLKHHNKTMFSIAPCWWINRIMFMDQNVIDHGTLSEEIREVKKY
jgi:hypothetical protein